MKNEMRMQEQKEQLSFAEMTGEARRGVGDDRRGEQMMGGERRGERRR